MCALFKKKVKKTTGILDLSDEGDDAEKKVETANAEEGPIEIPKKSAAVARARAITFEPEEGLDNIDLSSQKKKTGSYGTSNMDKPRKKKDKLKFLANPFSVDISAKINNQTKASQSHYTSDYLQELKTQNQRLNSTTKEVMRQTVDEEIIAEDNYIEEKPESDKEGEMIPEVLAKGPQEPKYMEIPSSKMDLEEIAQGEELLSDKEDDEENIYDKQKIKEARIHRESQRNAKSGKKKRIRVVENLNKNMTGEYIPLRNTGKASENYAYENNDKRRITMKGVIKQQENRKTEFLADLAEGLSSDEEFPEYEKNLLNRALEKTRETNGKKGTNEKQAQHEIKKLGTKELNMQLDDIKPEKTKEIDEHVLYMERVIADKRKNISELNDSIASSIKNIESLEIDQKTGAVKFDEIKELFEFWSELSDMLGEKQTEITGAKLMLFEAASKYHQESMSYRMRNLNSDLIASGSRPIEIPYASNHKKPANPAVIEKGAKPPIDGLMKSLRSHREMRSTEYDTTMYGYATSDEEEEDFAREFFEAKTEIHEAANRDIFKDVDDEFKAIGRIFEQVLLYKKIISNNPDDLSVATLVWDGLKLFYDLEFLGYDPLGTTLNTFEYHSTLDFQLIKGYDILMKILTEASSQDSKETLVVLRVLKQKVLEEVVGERLLNIITYEWNFFSREQTKNLAFVLELFKEKAYQEAHDKKSQSIIEIIKKILSALLEKIKESLILIHFPQELKSKLSEKTVWRVYKAIENIFTIGSLLPQSNLSSLILVELLGKIVENNLPFLDLKLQIEFMIKVLELIPEKFKRNENFIQFFANLKNAWYLQIVKNFDILVMQEQVYQNPEMEKMLLREKLIYLGNMF